MKNYQNNAAIKALEDDLRITNYAIQFLGEKKGGLFQMKKEISEALKKMNNQDYKIIHHSWNHAINVLKMALSKVNEGLKKWGSGYPEQKKRQLKKQKQLRDAIVLISGFRSVRVLFDDPTYNYTTSINGQLSKKKAIAYFEGQTFNMGSVGDNLQKCIRAEIVY